MEESILIIKPDCVQKGFAGEIIKRIERICKIQKIIGGIISKEKAEKHYEDYKEKPFFKELVEFITSDISIIILVSGEGIIDRCRKILGTTDPKQSSPGTIRGDFGESITKNAMHASDSIQNANREKNIFFNKEII